MVSRDKSPFCWVETLFVWQKTIWWALQKLKRRLLLEMSPASRFSTNMGRYRLKILTDLSQTMTKESIFHCALLCRDFSSPFLGRFYISLKLMKQIGGNTINIFKNLILIKVLNVLDTIDQIFQTKDYSAWRSQTTDQLDHRLRSHFISTNWTIEWEILVRV